MFPLAAEQSSMLFLEGLFGPGIFHNVSMGTPVAAGVGAAEVAAAVDRLSSRHELLRSTSVGSWSGVQAVRQASPGLVRVATGAEDPLDSFVRRRNELHNVPLDPERARFELLEADGDTPRYLLGMFAHLVCDGQSAAILKDDLNSLLAGGELTPLVPLAEFWKSREITDQARAAELRHWRSALSGCPPIDSFMPRSADRSGYVRSQVDRETPGGGAHAVLRVLVEDLRATAFSVVAALLAVAVWRRSGRTAFLLHTPVSTRRGDTARAMAGNFVLDRPIPCRIDPDQRFADLVRRVHADVFNGLRRAGLSVPELACAVPEYGGALAGEGADYLQLHVDLQSGDGVEAVNSPGGSTGVVRLGKFEPAGDITVSTLRFRFSESRLFTRTFSGGPPEGIERVEELRADVLAMLHATDLHEGAVGALAQAADRARKDEIV
ncbi:condensation domain-containing protein [Streptomyces sp. NPDC051563]|uniref:condensation domain-containing protein n=1 Tax=Streptomyces sp. NPDC051563 TaxID=3365659 RepID=UPI003799341E